MSIDNVVDLLLHFSSIRSAKKAVRMLSRPSVAVSGTIKLTCPSLGCVNYGHYT